MCLVITLPHYVRMYIRRVHSFDGNVTADCNTVHAALKRAVMIRLLLKYDIRSIRKLD